MLFPRHLFRALFCATTALLTVLPAASATPTPAANAAPVALRKVPAALLAHEGTVEVSLILTEPALVEKLGKGAKRLPPALSRSQQQSHLAGVRAQQDRVSAQTDLLGGRELARLSKLLNVMVVAIDASALPALADMPEIRRIEPIVQYELHLSTTVPYIGATAAHGAGVTGANVRVAVLDSGIDYTHRNLGGPGTVEAYQAAYANPTDPAGLFPTAKVVGGYDFVGELWPTFGPRSEDPDPIDFQGHGTNVADIIAGRSLDGLHRGVAPGALLYAFKVCSAVSSSCNGISILRGLEACLDPDGDGDISDAVDIVNLSLGAAYGQIENVTSLAVQNLTEFGVVVVASAGNSGDRPFITGSPSMAPGAISVAQTQTPDAKAFRIVIDGSATPVTINNTASLDWAPVDVAVSGSIVLGGFACSSFPAGTDFTGQVVLIDRGVCNISFKVDRAAKLGAAGVIIANNSAGDPPSFSFGGSSDGDPFLAVPTLVISLADANAIKALLASGPLTASFGPDIFLPLVGSMVATSSRGPSLSFKTIKPDIGAPGASVSATARTGSGQLPFGGTSGAAPMVAGAAALLLEVQPDLAPHEVKARLMNTAETAIYTNLVTAPGVRAPITRIGSGEARVDRALATQTLAYDAESMIASLSFGYVPVGASTSTLKLRRSLLIRNDGDSARSYRLSATFRDPADEASGAVKVSVPTRAVRVDPGASASVNVVLEIDPSKLPEWTLNSGPSGGSGPLLSAHEFDGYVIIEGGDETVTVPWHVLPRRAAANQVASRSLNLPRGTGSYQIRNQKGAATGTTELFALTGVSPVDYPPDSAGATPDLAAVGVRYLPEGGVLQFAIATHNEFTHANYPFGFEVYLDVNGDDQPDFIVYNTELGAFASSGQNVTYLYRVSNGANTPYYFTDADVISQTAILMVPMAALGVPSTTQLGVAVYVFDNYFTGNFTDVIDDDGGFIRFTPSAPRFTTSAAQVDVAPGASMTVAVTHNPAADAASPGQIGLLHLHRNAQPGAWWSVLPVSVR
jgi:minor extracellular serine protease Vpr